MVIVLVKEKLHFQKMKRKCGLLVCCSYALVLNSMSRYSFYYLKVIGYSTKMIKLKYFMLLINKKKIQNLRQCPVYKETVYNRVVLLLPFPEIISQPQQWNILKCCSNEGNITMRGDGMAFYLKFCS